MLISDSVANQILDAVFSATSISLGATLFYDLTSTVPLPDGTNVTVPTDANYTGITKNRNLTDYAAAASRSKASGTAFTWPASTGGGSGYPGIVGVAVWTSSARTTFVGYADIAAGASDFPAGEAANIPAGSLTWSIPAT